MSTIIVDSRRKDVKSIEVEKYYNEAGITVQTKPVRKICPDFNRLSTLAKFIASRANDKYIGGMLLNGFIVRIEGPEGSMYEIEARQKGIRTADTLFKMWGFNKKDRAIIKGWLFPVFEPENDETEYFNCEAIKIARAAGVNGRVIINDEVYNIAEEDTL
jgi:hypothetical protein